MPAAAWRIQWSQNDFIRRGSPSFRTRFSNKKSTQVSISCVFSGSPIYFCSCQWEHIIRQLKQSLCKWTGKIALLCIRTTMFYLVLNKSIPDAILDRYRCTRPIRYTCKYTQYHKSAVHNHVDCCFFIQRGPKVTSLVARSSSGRCTQHVTRIRRESGAYVTQMLRAWFAYDVRGARNKRCYFWTPL
jgi:hypothetical protein